ncbi:MAG TPA: exo-alpha-sialidase [Bacillus bacterium]|nr:exo-alpha-sialidase [Bacillus sp. (in: firmicutes)]
MGIVFVQNITMLSIWQEILKIISQVTGTTSYPVNFTVAFIISMIIPVAMLWVTSLVVSNKKNWQSIKEYFVRFGYAIIPLDLAGHIAHNLFHLLTEGKSIGYNTIALFGINMQAGDLAFTSTFTVQVLQFIIIGLGFFGSAYTVYRMSNKQTFKRMLLFYALMFVFAIVNIYGLNQMGEGEYGAGIFKSTDGGQNWEKIEPKGLSEDLHKVYAMVALPDNENTLLAGTESGIMRSDDGGKTWVMHGGERFITAFAVIPNENKDLISYSITKDDAAIMISKDAANYISVNPENLKQILVSSFNNSVFVSEDGGDNWNEVIKAGAIN